MSEENQSTAVPTVTTSPERRQAAVDAARAVMATKPTPEATTTGAAPAPSATAPASTQEAQEATTADAQGVDVAAEKPFELAVKIKQREQRIREQAATKYAAKERELSQREQQLQQQAQRYAHLENLAKTDPTKLFQEIGFQEKDYIRARLETGKPEAQISVLQRQIDEERQARQQMVQQIQEQRAAEDRSRQESSFLSMALDTSKYPTLATVYEGATNDLTQEAYRVQDAFVAQHGRVPDLEEICINLEAMERQKAARYARLSGKAPAAAASAPKGKGPKAIPADTSGRDQKDRVLTGEDRRQRALDAGRKVLANYKK